MINKPTTDPSWATDATHPSGSDPWSGQPNRSAPSSARRGEGYTPDVDDIAEEDNYILNSHGEHIKWLRSTVEGYGVTIRDHFLGATQPDPNLWVTSIPSGGSISTIDDRGAGANGAIAMLDASGAGSTQLYLGSQIHIGAKDFSIHGRIRVVTLFSTSGFQIGLSDGGGDGHTMALSVTNSTMKLVYSSSSTVDNFITLSGITVGTGYHTFEIARAAGVLTTTVDQVVVDTRAHTFDLGYCLPSMLLGAVGSSAEVRIDRVAYWFPE